MAPTAPHLVEEILEEIFLRLATPAALARASAACASFRRIISERTFLRRFRALHLPPLLGFVIDEYGFYHAQEPHPSAPLSRALADGADFSYSFVPRPPSDDWLTSWCSRDVLDGRVLLACRSLAETGIETIYFSVCDPLSRRYVLLPPLLEEITTVQQEELPFELGPVLAPIGEDEDETLFKVICLKHYESKLVAHVFSSVTGQWCVAASPSWSSLGAVEPPLQFPAQFQPLAWLLLLDQCLEQQVSCARNTHNEVLHSRYSYRLPFAAYGPASTECAHVYHR